MCVFIKNEKGVFLKYDGRYVCKVGTPQLVFHGPICIADPVAIPNSLLLNFEEYYNLRFEL